MAFSKDFIWCVGGAAVQQDGGYLIQYLTLLEIASAANGFPSKI